MLLPAAAAAHRPLQLLMHICARLKAALVCVLLPMLRSPTRTSRFPAAPDATRILREIKLLRLLRHPDIVEIKHIMLPVRCAVVMPCCSAVAALCMPLVHVGATACLPTQQAAAPSCHPLLLPHEQPCGHPAAMYCLADSHASLQLLPLPPFCSRLHATSRTSTWCLSLWRQTCTRWAAGEPKARLELKVRVQRSRAVGNTACYATRSFQPLRAVPWSKPTQNETQPLLLQVIKANDDLTPEHHQFFLYQMLRGLKYIHSAKVSAAHCVNWCVHKTGMCAVQQP